MTYTEHNLPFSELSPQRFEQLCFALLREEGHTDVRHWGAGGSDEGCDLVSTARDGRRWVTQAKRTTSFGPTPAVKELVKVLNKPPAPEPVVYHLVAPCNLTRDTEEALEKKIAESGKTWVVKCWGLTELDAKVRTHPEVKDRFFGKHYELLDPHWNVLNSNPYFTGRDDLLRALETQLDEAGTAALTQAITGLGGIGKTQIALEFCHRHRTRYDEIGIFWADASSADTLRAAYKDFAVNRRLAAPDASVEDASTGFQRWLSAKDGWLLVLDNADDPGEVKPLIPRAARGHVIITTRARIPALGRDPLRVDVLPRRQAIEFLLERAGRGAAERASAKELADALGCLPLALEQAGAYLAHHHSAPIAGYLKAFQAQGLRTMEKQDPEQGEYERTVLTTWEMSFQKVEETSPAAAEALRVCAFLAPGGIPPELFVSAGDRLGPALDSLAEEAKEDALAAHERLVEPLTRYSLVTYDTQAEHLSMHRLVQAVLRVRLRAQGQAANLLKRVHHALDSRFPQDPESPASWPEGALWFPHVQSILEAWRVPLTGDKERDWDPTDLWDRAGRYAWAAGLASGARELHEEALSVRRHTFGEEHSQTLNSMGNLASALWALGDASEARELHEKRLSVCRRVLGDEHPETLQSMNELAVSLLVLGDTSGARKLHEEALLIRRRVLGTEHPQTLQSMNNLAVTLIDVGDMAGARELLEETLVLRRRVLGEEHPHTLNSTNNLARTFSALGHVSKARDLQEKELSVSRRVLGEEHPDTLTSKNNLAMTLRDLGDASGARELIEEVLSIRRRVLGEEHRDTLSSMNSLAATLRDLGDASGARELVEEVLSMSRRVLGEEHPQTLSAMTGLAITLRDLGDVSGAKVLLEETLSVSSHVLGEEHPDTLNLLHHLCITLEDLGEFDPRLIDRLLTGACNLPERTPIRVKAVERWGRDDLPRTGGG